MSEVGKGADCTQCGHPFGPHLFVVTGDGPLRGGVVLCNLQGCDCIGTWSAGGGTRDQVRMPDDEELAAIRAQVQS